MIPLFSNYCLVLNCMSDTRKRTSKPWPSKQAFNLVDCTHFTNMPTEHAHQNVSGQTLVLDEEVQCGCVTLMAGAHTGAARISPA